MDLNYCKIVQNPASEIMVTVGLTYKFGVSEIRLTTGTRISCGFYLSGRKVAWLLPHSFWQLHLESKGKVMKIMKISILAGVAALTFAAAVPAQASWGSTGLGSSGWGSSGHHGTSSSSTGGSSSGGTSSSSGGSSTGGTQVPEPSNLLMLGLGVAGLVAGRFAARRKRKRS